MLTSSTVVHLTAILENDHIATLKPEATQVLLQQALREHPSSFLELASSGYHVRRTPSSYPPKYLPHNSFEQVNDDGLSFWDQRTIYVEPHLRTLCQTSAKVAYWLKEHGQLKPKWLPIQAVHMLYNSCAFVVLSGNVMHEDAWSKWRAAEKPDGWKIMTKVEHTKRTAEYIALLEKRNPKSIRKPKPELLHWMWRSFRVTQKQSNDQRPSVSVTDAKATKATKATKKRTGPRTLRPMVTIL
jgi:hypothetical protein